VQLAVVIPALDEAGSIGGVVAGIPRAIGGVGRIDVIVVDDGSRDETSERALAAGAATVVRHVRNRGLAAAFNSGISAALERGADLIVQLDADGQHDPADIPALLEPILIGAADMAVGVRALRDAGQGTRFRRLGNRVGSSIFRRALQLDVSDFTSGYRAYSREAALRLHVVYDHTYTLETMIQAARKRLAVAQVPIHVQERRHGVSRMTHSIVRYIARACTHSARSMLHDNPLRGFLRMAALTGTAAVAMTVWFVLSYQDGGLHLPLLLADLLAVMTTGGLAVCGLLADGISLNRRLLEDALHMIKRDRLGDSRHAGLDLMQTPALSMLDAARAIELDGLSAADRPTLAGEHDAPRAGDPARTSG
jgi:hypothetical protein